MDDAPHLKRIEGYFNANDEPAIKLDLISSTLEVLIDTGFAGSLIIPEPLSVTVELQFEGFNEFLTATGELLVARAYSTQVSWLGQRIKVPVAVSPIS
jgi:predicted aspartyl protease